MANYLWLIPCLPLLGALLNGLGALTGKLSRQVVNWLACGVVGLAFVLAVLANLELTHGGGHGEAHALVNNLYPWITAGTFRVDVGFVVDNLSGVMILVVTGVGFLIHLYSTGYMDHEPAYARYFAYLNLFTFAMLVLVMGENLLMLFVGWEGVGLCSYLLIGFWYQDNKNADAGKKAFIVNRVGDFGFVLGLFLLYWSLSGSGLNGLSFEALRQVITANPLPSAIATAVCLLLFVGATGKSAQIPLYVWLPDAMAGPTPVSALIHAATMVTAGIYMITRLNFLFVLSPVAMTVIAVVGATTALFAATIGLTQNDIKKVLAYSTVSQLGYMFLGVGVGAFSAGMFHLVTHAFFKACLFLGSGAVIHALHGEQDIRKMGGLRTRLPSTYWTFLLATIAIAGIFPTAGFMSKDEILARALSASPELILVPGWLLYGAGFIGALLTTFYMFRLVFLTFFGTYRGDEHTLHHLHKPGLAMVLPLVVLAFLSIVGGFLNVPAAMPAFIGGGTEYFHHWLSGVVKEPAFQPLEHATEHGLILGLQLMVLGMIALAWHLYGKRPELPARLAEALGGVYRLSLNKYYVDELYERLIIRPLHALSDKVLWKVVDMKLIDGAINGLAKGLGWAGQGLSALQGGVVNSYALSLVLGLVVILSYLLVR